MSKRKGTRNEHKAIKILEAAGYACTRSGGSLGVFDIIAISRAGVILVQVKTNRNAPPSERALIKLFPVPCGVQKQIWIFHDYVREPRILDF